jgi:SNF2 family DNA or RNA helicase
MGLGKTLQLLAHVASLIEQGVLEEESKGGRNGPWRPVLIIAPLLLVESGVWTDEMAARFRDGGRTFEPWVVLRDEGLKKVRRDAGGIDELGKPLLDPAKLMAHKVVITTYETMMAYQHSLAQRVGGRPLWSLVIFDEAQEVKSPKTKQSIAAKALDGMFKVAATGTPVETRLRDLWNLMDTVEPTYLRTQREFVVQYERPAMNPESPGDRERALHSLRSALRLEQPSAYLLRRDKSILRTLPARHEHRVMCPYRSEERVVIGGIRAALHRPSAKKSALSIIHQLHLASQHPVLVRGRADTVPVEQLLAQSGRLQGLVRILQKIQRDGEKALVFARSVEAQRLLARVISETFHTSVDIVNGQTGLSAGRAGSGAARRAILQRFRQREGFGVIVLSPFVAGVGLTLTEANHVIHYGRWWNPAIENQATDRAYRIGQTKAVHVYYLVSVDEDAPDNATFDQVLDELLRARNRLARDFLMPQSEDESASQLVRMLEHSTPPDTLAFASTVTSRHVAALLCVQATQSGGQAVWLGDEGLYGAHVLRRMSGVFEAVQLQDPADLPTLPSLKDTEQTWRTVLGLPELQATRVVASGSDGWSPLVSELVKSGVAPERAWDPLEAQRDLGEIQSALRQHRH